MDCKQTKRKKQNKTEKHTITQIHNKQQKRTTTTTKIPPSTQACTYTFWNISMVMKATLNTTYPNTSLTAWRENNHQK